MYYSQSDCHCYVNQAQEIFSLAATGTLPGFNGVKLGDSYDRVIELMGPPEMSVGGRDGTLTYRGIYPGLGYDANIMTVNLTDRKVSSLSLYIPIYLANQLHPSYDINPNTHLETFRHSYPKPVGAVSLIDRSA